MCIAIKQGLLLPLLLRGMEVRPNVGYAPNSIRCKSILLPSPLGEGLGVRPVVGWCEASCKVACAEDRHLTAVTTKHTTPLSPWRGVGGEASCRVACTVWCEASCRPVCVAGLPSSITICPFFSKEINTKTAHFAHQPPTHPQKFNSRTSLF